MLHATGCRCCVLHNMLLDHDEIEKRLLEMASGAARIVQADIWVETDRLWTEIGMHE